MTNEGLAEDRLQQKPIIDRLHPDQVKLLAARANASGQGEVTRGELAAFLELAANYGLDPFANEVWLAKGKQRQNGGPGRVLIMVGRDGLRKIAAREGLTVDGDVIHENDTFEVQRSPDGKRAIHHSYSHPKDRGPIVGAWCMVSKRTSGGGLIPRLDPRGFYVATVEEFKPKSQDALRFSPWGAQESVMILAAAERQALRQATPLSGLLAEGELDRGEELAAGALPAGDEVSLDELLGLPMGEHVAATVRRARKLGHAGYSDAGTAALALSGQHEGFVRAWLAAANEELDAYRAPGVRDDDGPEEEPTEAQVVEDGAAAPEGAEVESGSAA